MNQRDFPGFGDYILGKGATTLWENWNGKSSHSHPMYGSVIRWFYQAVAGIYPDEKNPGFKHVIIKPSLCSDLTFASADYNSLHGKIKSAWRLEGKDLYMNTEIPTNTKATIYIPSTDQSKISEGGKSISSMTGIEFIKSENDRVVYAVGSGKYSFISKDAVSLIKPVSTSTPIISPVDTLFTKPGKAKISIESVTEGATIYYTLDGSIPSEKSSIYSGHMSLESDATLRAMAIKDGYLPSYIKSENVKFADPEINGLNYTVYEGEWDERPDIRKIKPVSSGRQYDFNVNRIKKREDYVAIIFKGFIQINYSGIYTFYSSANDGSWFYVDNKLVVENTGDNNSGKESGEIRLEKGKYPLKVIYYENGGTEALDVFMEGPGIEKQTIPVSLLFLE